VRVLDIDHQIWFVWRRLYATNYEIYKENNLAAILHLSAIHLVFNRLNFVTVIPSLQSVTT
jgi:hypothetical protein